MKKYKLIKTNTYTISGKVEEQFMGEGEFGYKYDLDVYDKDKDQFLYNLLDKNVGRKVKITVEVMY